MTELLERAFDRAMALSPDLQDEVARMILSFAGDVGQTVPLTPEERAVIERSPRDRRGAPAASLASCTPQKGGSPVSPCPVS